MIKKGVLIGCILIFAVVFFTGCSRDQEVISSDEKQSIDQRTIDMVQKATDDPVLQQEMQEELQFLVDTNAADIETIRIEYDYLMNDFDYLYNGDQAAPRFWIRQQIEPKPKDSFVTSDTFFSNELCINEQTEVKVLASTNTDWSKDSLMVVYDENRMISQMRYDLRLFERDISLVELFCESIDQESGVKKVEPMQGIGYANLSQYLFINNNEKDKYLPLIRRVLLAMKNNDLALLQRESVYNQEDIFSFLPFPHLQDLRQGVQFDNKIIGKASMSSMSDNYLVDYRISLSGEYLILDISNPQVKIFDGNTYTFYTGYISLELNNVFYDQ